MLPDFIAAAESAAHAILLFMGKNLVYSAWLSAGVLVTTLLCRIRSPHLLYGLWLLVLVRLIMPPDVALPFSVRSLLVHAGMLPESAQRLSIIGDALSTKSALVASAFDQSAHRVPEPSARMTPPSSQRFPWQFVLLAVWLIGLGVFALASLRRMRSMRNVLKRATDLHDRDLQRFVDDWRWHFKIKREVRLVSSDDYLSPFTSGMLYPVIFLPAGFLVKAASAEIEAVIAHELAHIRRWDHLQLRMQNVVQLLYFYNPLVWLAASQLNHQRERICDAMVLNGGKLPRSLYANTMLRLLQLSLNEPGSAAIMPAFGNEKRRLAMRLKEIIQQQVGNKMTTKKSFLLFTVAALFVLPMAPAGKPIRTTAIQNEPPAVAFVIQASADTIALQHPLPTGRLTAGFGKSVDPFTQRPRHHQGLDLAAPKGTPIKAAAAGTITVAAFDSVETPAYGRRVVIDHGGGWKTLYAQMDSITVGVGQKVDAQQTIGTVGSSGRSTGPHLHFEVIKDGTPVDPAQLLHKPKAQQLQEEHAPPSQGASDQRALRSSFAALR